MSGYWSVMFVINIRNVARFPFDGVIGDDFKITAWRRSNPKRRAWYSRRNLNSCFVISSILDSISFRRYGIQTSSISGLRLFGLGPRYSHE